MKAIGSYLKKYTCVAYRALWGQYPTSGPLPSTSELHQKLGDLDPNQGANEVLTNWMRMLYTQDPLVIAAQIGNIHPHNIGGGAYEAERRRLCAQAILNAKLSEGASLQAARLELASRRLQIVGFLVAVLTLFATVASIW